MRALVGGGAPWVALAVLVRVAWVLAVPSKPVGDFAMYLESAAHLRELGALDGEFVYMPGYVALVAVVQAAAGGVRAVKLVGALLGGLGAGAAFGVARALFGLRAARVAGALAALWPGGVAVASVTGTDMPTATLIGGATWLLVRTRSEARAPWRAAAGFGLLMAAAAWMRAVAVPLAAVAGLHFLVTRTGVRRALAAGALALAIAFAALLPWALRNHARYGEWFFTDSHGGLTALVGAYPNTDGRYTRALNRTFAAVTGWRWLQEPHREADRTAYRIAKDFFRFEPAYGLALVADKADRLLGRERSLLYWPLYRAGVLPPPARAFWDRQRSALEVITDAWWAVVLLGGIAGAALALARGVRAAWAPLAIAAALTALYAAFFAEARYHLPIALLLIPFAAGAVSALGEALFRLMRGSGWPAGPALHRALIAAAAPAVAWGAWEGVQAAATRVREGHRWAVHVCAVDQELPGRPSLCSWRRDPAASAPDGPSDILGVYDGVGLRGGTGARAAVLTLPPLIGPAMLSATLDAFARGASPACGELALVALGSGGKQRALLRVPVSRLLAAGGVAVRATLSAADARLRFAYAPGDCPAPGGGEVRAWLTGLSVATEREEERR